MKLNVTIATTVLFVTLSLFKGTESRSIAPEAQIGSSREKRGGLGREKRSWDNYEMDEPEYDDVKEAEDSEKGSWDNYDINEPLWPTSTDGVDKEDSEKGSWDNYDMIEPLWPTPTDGVDKEDSEKECDECEECEEKENNGIAGFYDDD